MFCGKSMGGGSHGNIIRTASRAVARAGVSGAGSTSASRPSSPTASSSRAASRHGGSAHFHSLLSSSPLSYCPVSATSGGPTGWYFCNPYSDDFDLISEDEIESENVARVCEDPIGWSVPSLDEVHGAVSAIHQYEFQFPLTVSLFFSCYCDFFGGIFIAGDFEFVEIRVFGQENDEQGRVGMYTGLVNRVSPFGSDVDWVEPCLELQLSGRGVQRVYDAFHLLQTDPSVQRMVMSVSSDKAVWDAIMNNESVQHLRKSFYEEKDEALENSVESSPSKPSGESMNIVQWIFVNTKTRVMEVIEKITELMNHLFESGNDDGDSKKRRAEGRDLFEEKLKTSFLISIVVLLVVMVSRAHKAS